MIAVQNLRFGLPVINVLHNEIKISNSTEVFQEYASLSFKQRLQLEHVCYQYCNTEQQVLNDITMNIPYGVSVEKYFS